MVKAEEVKALLPTGEPHDPGLVGMQLQSQRAKDRRHPPPRLLSGCPASAEHDVIVGEAHKHPEPAAGPRPFRIQHVERDVAQQGRNRRALWGGVPDPLSVVTPSSSTPPAAKPEAAAASPGPRPAWPTNEQGILPDRPEAVPDIADIGVEHPLNAPVGLGPDRLTRLVGGASRTKPVACGRKSASNTGSRISFAAVITTRSRTHGIDSGLVRPGWPGLGCEPAAAAPAGRSRHAAQRQGRREGCHPGRLDLDASTCRMVTPSTPGAPRLARTSSQAHHRTSLRATLSNRAWKRRDRSCLAPRYSTRCKARDLSRPSAFAVDRALTGHSPIPP
jgi:hypothetical protein